jgi:branched-subunit amino acid ABC-type transport system permease component
VTVFWEYALLGVGVGGIYALAAQGMVLIYRGSGVVNFAQGAMAMVGAYAYYEATQASWPLWAAIPFGVLAAASVGALTHLLIMRKLTDASPLTRMVATLGIFTLLTGLAVGRYGATQQFVAPLLPQNPVGWVKHLFGSQVAVSADRLWLLLIGAVVASGCWAVYRYTRFGLTTRAVAEKPLAAASLGRSPDLVATVNWAAGAGLAGLAGILLIGITGLSVGLFSLLLIPALAAALVGRFTSFPATWAAGVAVGIVETLLTSNAHWLPGFLKQPGWSVSVPFVLIIGLLMLTGRALPLRDHVIQRQPHAGSGRVRWGIVVPVVVAVVVLCNGLGFLGYGGVQVSWVDALTVSAAVAVIALSQVVVTGYAGQLSLAQFTLAGVGAFVAARLAAGAPILGLDLGASHVPFALALLLAVAITVPVGVIAALPALRTRGVELAIATLGLALIVEELLFGNSGYTGGASGTKVNPPSLLGVDLDPITHPQRYATFCLALLVLIGVLVANLRRSPSGRRLLAVRSNERAAASLGISVAGAKLYAFGVAAAIAAVGGVLLAFQERYVLFDQYNVTASIELVVSTVIGGIAYVGGGILAGLSTPGGVVSLIFTKALGTSALFNIGWGLNLSFTLPVLFGGTLPFILIWYPSGVCHHLAERTGPRVDSLAARFGVRRKQAEEGFVDQTEAEAQAEPVRPQTLRIDGLTVRFGAVTAVDDVSLVVEPGTVVGLIGPNGAGKTTILDAATGFTRSDSGTITLDHIPITNWSPRRRAQQG